MKYCLFLLYFCIYICSVTGQTQHTYIISVTASSYIDYQSQYLPDKIFDKRPETGWLENSMGDGIGETILLKLYDPVTVDTIEVMPGYFDPRYWQNNNRVKELKVYFNSKPVLLRFKDEMIAQTITLPEPVSASIITFEITDIFPSGRDNDCGISDIRFFYNKREISLIPAIQKSYIHNFTPHIFGSIKIITTTKGNLFVDGIFEKKLDSNETYVLDNLVPGNYRLRMVYAYYKIEDIIITVEEQYESIYKFKHQQEVTEKYWHREFGGGRDDTLTSIIDVADGYLIAGHTKSKNIEELKNSSDHYHSTDFYVVKTDGMCNMEWHNMYGGIGTESQCSIIETNDSSYLIAGISSSPKDDSVNKRELPEYSAIMIDEKGNIQWQEKYKTNWKHNHLEISSLNFSSIIETMDNGYIFAGTLGTYSIHNHSNQQSFIYLIKINSKGRLEWSNTYGKKNSYVSQKYSKTITDVKNGFIICGYSDSTEITKCNNNGGYDIYIFKIDLNGKLIWQKMFGGEGSDIAHTILKINTGEFLIGGESSSKTIPGLKNNGSSDFYLIKINAHGNIIEQNMFGGTGHDVISIIKKSNTGDFIIGGTSSSDEIGLIGYGNIDFYIAKMNSSYKISWEKKYGGNQADILSGILEIDDGLLIAGTSSSYGIPELPSGIGGSSDYYILKVNSRGEFY